MGYKTTHAILDSLDKDQYYYGGAIYPRQGLEVAQERLDELVEKGHIIKIDDEPSLPSKEEEKPVVDEPTVDEIKAVLDELGIKYSSRAKKAELLELLKGV